jgi:hypothetical protein
MKFRARRAARQNRLRDPTKLWLMKMFFVPELAF